MRALLLLCTTLVFTISSVGQEHPKVLSGRWKGTEKELVITVSEGKDGLYYGKDSKGKLMLDRLRYDAKEGVYRGTLQPPDRPNSIPVTVTVESPDRLRLDVRKFLMTKTIYLIRWEKD
jgi:hypothetical protein